MAKADNIWKMEIHPAAAIFPMLPEDELNEMAADIKVNGLTHPIVVKDGLLIDGRNRREACKRAGIEPQAVELNGADPVAYVLSANINRRHMTKGQRAMVVAKLYPEPKIGGARKKGEKAGQNNFDLSSEYLKQARTVLKQLPEMADLVLAGVMPLNEAYEKAQEFQQQTESEPKRLARLRESAPDLAELVAEERMSLNEAMAAADARAAKEKAQRQALWTLLAELFDRADVIHDARLDYAARTIMAFPKECPMKSLKAFLDQIQADAKELQERLG